MDTPSRAADRSQQAVDYVTSCCGRIGAFQGTSDVHDYIRETAAEIAASQLSTAFPGRYKEHVVYAMNMVASNMSISSPAAIASPYLATRFEFYFRVLSSKLNNDGTWVSQDARKVARGGIKDRRFKNSLKRKHISNIAVAYKIMKLDQTLQLVQHCEALDRKLYSTPIKVVGGFDVTDIGDRIAFSRHAAGHGEWGDISSEALFLGLTQVAQLLPQERKNGKGDITDIWWIKPGKSVMSPFLVHPTICVKRIPLGVSPVANQRGTLR